MAETKVDTAKETTAAKPAASADAAVEKKVATEAKETKSKVDAVVSEKKPETDAAKPEPKKAEEPKEATSSSVRTLNSEGASSPHGEPKNFRRNATIGLLGGTAAMATLSPSFLAQLPLIGKIPYLPQAAAALQTGIQNMIAPLGWGTGVSATNHVMAGLPLIGTLPTAVGATATGAVAIPAALWALGLGINFVSGNRKDGLGFGNITQACRTIAGLPFKTQEAIMNTRDWAVKKAEQTWGIATSPFKGAWNLAGKIAKSAWHTTAATTSATLTPTKWGIGGALLGIALSGGTAAAIPVTAGLGYGIMNYLKNTGALDPKDGGSHSGKNGH